MVTFSKPITHRGSNQITINVNKNGRPFGQIWTFRDTVSDTHPWHGKTLAGVSTYIYNGRKTQALADVQAWMIDQAA